jgi:hypothetical protein
MRLGVLTDASYLSRPNAGSVAGSFYHLCRHSDPTFVNASISVVSNRIPIVCSSVQEAEYAGTFGAAKVAVGERQILSDLGYSQPPTVIFCDNEVAVGIANRAIKPKLSKSTDMRLHWLEDRVRQLQFRVRHISGLQNIADFFTKSLPLTRHNELAPFIAVDDASLAADMHAHLTLQ